jgi:DNA-binding transcriptional regulator YhcF (GntR family)
MRLIALLWAIRDSRCTRNANRQLLDALGMRCNPAKGYTCWPSYELLAKDTGCNVATLKKAAAALEKMGLIRRRQRRNKSNIFVLNIDKILQLAETKRAEDRAKQDVIEGPFFPITEPTSHSLSDSTELEEPESEYTDIFQDGESL